MPKPRLIDGNQLREWVNLEIKDIPLGESKGKIELLKKMLYMLAAGTFDPTPPVQPDIKIGDTVKTNTVWTHLVGKVTGVSEYKAMIDFGFPYVEFEIPLEQLEVIK